ncbi:MAG: hypothetical protein WDW36_008611 [Sanguina aurantia]
MVVSSSVALAAHAEEAAVAADAAVLAVTETPEVAATLEAAAAPLSTPGELAVIAAPLVLYGIFNGYRSFVNPKATFNDFLFLTVALGIVYNIVSIVVFKAEVRVQELYATLGACNGSSVLVHNSALLPHIRTMRQQLQSWRKESEDRLAEAEETAAAAKAESQHYSQPLTFWIVASVPHQPSATLLTGPSVPLALMSAPPPFVEPWQAMHSTERALSEIQHQHAELTQLHSSQTTEQQHREARYAQLEAELERGKDACVAVLAKADATAAREAESNRALHEVQLLQQSQQQAMQLEHERRVAEMGSSHSQQVFAVLCYGGC